MPSGARRKRLQDSPRLLSHQCGAAHMSAEEPSDSKCNEPLVDEKLMIELLHRGKHQDALTLLQQTSTINVRMINMGFSARVAAGQRIETSSMEMLQLCEANELAPTRAMYNNVYVIPRSDTGPSMRCC